MIDVSILINAQITLFASNVTSAYEIAYNVRDKKLWL